MQDIYEIIKETSKVYNVGSKYYFYKLMKWKCADYQMKKTTLPNNMYLFKGRYL